MSLGVAAVVKPLRVSDAGLLHLPMAMMLVALCAPLALAARRRALNRNQGVALLTAYPVFVAIVLMA